MPFLMPGNYGEAWQMDEGWRHWNHQPEDRLQGQGPTTSRMLHMFCVHIIFQKPKLFLKVGWHGWYVVTSVGHSVVCSGTEETLDVDVDVFAPPC